MQKYGTIELSDYGYAPVSARGCGVLTKFPCLKSTICTRHNINNVHFNVCNCSRITSVVEKYCLNYES